MCNLLHITYCRVLVDPKPIMGTLGARHEFSLDRTAVYCRAPHTQIHTHIHTYGHFSFASAPTSMFWGGGINPEETHMNMGRKLNCQYYI